MRALRYSVLALALCAFAADAAAWDGFQDRSVTVGTARFDFGTSGGSNENYYDGDFGDYDGDGVADRALVSRYGLLWNSGEGVMLPVSTQRRTDVPPNSTPSLTGYLFGDEVSIGNDGVQWADVDGDGDLDSLSGGNGEAFVVQENRGGRFETRQRSSGSALDIVSIDIDRDGDVDFAAACWFPSGPSDFALWVNDGTGELTNQAAARGIAFASDQIVGVVAGDIDGDRDFDLILASHASEELFVMRNDGAGSFSRTRIPFAGAFGGNSSFSQGMNLGDIDGDGDPDLVTASDDYTSNHPRIGHTIFVNDGAGNFVEESASRWDVGAATFIGRLVGGNGKLLDVDYDGDLDFFAFTGLAGPPINFQLFLNDGTGRFVYADGGGGLVPPVGSRRAGSSAIGSDTDVTDLDRDGSYDVWVGVGGGLVTTLFNTYRDPSGLPADVPRNVSAGAAAGGVTLSFDPPPFAATARHYVVYRSLAPGLGERDRTKLHVIANSRYEDEGFSAPITATTTTAYLGDPDVTLASGRVTFIDRTAVPGVAYAYSVAHVGTENTRSVPSAEVIATVPADGAPDTRGPELEILSPSVESWSAHPRVVLAFADGASGVDPASLQVTLDAAAGATTAGTNLADRGTTRSANAWAHTLGPTEALASGIVTLTASITDLAGNRSTRTVRFFVSMTSAAPPTASFVATPSSGPAPLDVQLVATATDPDGEVLGYEWELGDGTTGLGRRLAHRYTTPGTYTVRLVVRDDEGGIALASSDVQVGACVGSCTPPPDAGGPIPGSDGGRPPPGTDAGPVDRVPIRATGSDGGCSAVGATPASLPLLALAIAGTLAIGRRRTRRR